MSQHMDDCDSVWEYHKERKLIMPLQMQSRHFAYRQSSWGSRAGPTRLVHGVDDVHARKRPRLDGCRESEEEVQNTAPIISIGQSRRDHKACRDESGRSSFSAQIGQTNLTD